MAEYSAASLGRAFTGDASVVARNPTLMTQLDQREFSVTGTYVVSNVSLTGINTPTALTL